MATQNGEIASLTIRLFDDEGPSQGMIPTGAVSSDLTPTIRVLLDDAGLAAGDTLRAVVDGVPQSTTLILGDLDFVRGYVDVTTATIGQGVHTFGVDVLDATDAVTNSGVARGSFAPHPADGPGKAAILGLVETTGEGTAVDPSALGTNDVTPVVRVSLFDTDAVSGDLVRLNVDGQAGLAAVLSEADVAQGYVDLATQVLGEGVHMISAQVVDATGLAGAKSAILPVRVDLTAPGISLTAVATSAGQALANGGVSDDHALVFQFQVDDHRDAGPATAGPGAGHDIYTGLAAGVRVELYANGVMVGATDLAAARPDGLMQIQTGELSAGDYVFTLVAMDVSGNVGFTVTPFELHVSDSHLTASPYAGGASMTSGWVFEV